MIRPLALAAASVATAVALAASPVATPQARAATGTTSAARPSVTCQQPGAGAAYERTAPAEVDLDQARLQRALDYADTHLRLSVQVFRNSCLVGTGAGNALTQDSPYNVWSSTKSVISMLTGIAEGRGALRLDDPIGRYLPAGLGDAAHRAITIRQLLTETAGLKEAIGSEGATTGTDADVVREALAQPITSTPGSRFEYGQRTPDLLAFVVQRAVGEDLQSFAQRTLFGPIGITPADYFWLRDRSGHTYGYAHLFIEPRAFARLGLLMTGHGVYRGRQVVPASYLTRAASSSPHNGCYGFLFWTNAGKPCTGANVPSAETVDSHLLESAPPDLFAMVGAFQQNNFAIPSLGITVTWTGFLGDTTVTNLPELASAGPNSDLYHNFFRLLMRAVKDVHVPDPGPLKAGVYLDADPRNVFDPGVLLRDLFPSPDCTIVVCGGGIPSAGSRQSLEDAVRALTR